MNVSLTLDFLEGLRNNNQRDWFNANKSIYDQVREGMLGFLNNIIENIALFDNGVKGVKPNDCLFRIHRDVRFSGNKEPYKNNIGAFISSTGRSGNSPGYYVHIEPGNSMLAGGLYMPPPGLLKAVREEIYYNANEFLAIIGETGFVNLFRQLDNYDILSRPPKGFPPDWPYIGLLKYKSYTVSRQLSDEFLFSPELAAEIAMTFKVIYPLNLFLQRAANMQE